MVRKPDMKTTFHKLILLLWVCAISWIYLGNIINFHQYRILGRQLIPVALVNNREKEKDLLKAIEKVSYFPGYLSALPFSPTAVNGSCINDSREFVILLFPGPTSFQSLLYLEEHSLRAPPFISA